MIVNMKTLSMDLSFNWTENVDLACRLSKAVEIFVAFSETPRFLAQFSSFFNT